MDVSDTRGKKRRAEEPLTLSRDRPRPFFNESQINLTNYLEKRDPSMKRGIPNKERDESQMTKTQAETRRSRNSAVILQIQEEKLECKEVIKTLKQAIDPEKDLDIKDLQIRTTSSEGRVFTVRDEDANQKANLHMRKIKYVLVQYEDRIRCFRPKPRFTNFVMIGYDDSMTEDEIVAEIMKKTNCTEGAIRLGKIIEQGNRWKVSLQCEETHTNS